jgi:uncharacterized protein (DUF1778 family)
MMLSMATSKKTPKAARPRPDRYSKKRSGYVSQTVRISVEQNRLIREAADLEGMSISFWASRTLVAAAKKQIATAAKD